MINKSKSFSKTQKRTDSCKGTNLFNKDTQENQVNKNLKCRLSFQLFSAHNLFTQNKILRLKE